MLNHIPLFYILPLNGDALLFNDLCNAWGISKSSLSDIITRYETMGLVKKCECSSDKRSIYISLTPSAIKLKLALDKIEQEFLNLLLIDFNSEERIKFEKNIDKALNNGKNIP